VEHGKYHTKNKFSFGVLFDILGLHELYRGILYCQISTQFYGRRTNMVTFTSIRKVRRAVG